MKKKITKCIECGKEIEYKTNRPKRCKACNKSRSSRKRQKKRTGKKRSNWSKEYYMFKLLDKIFPGEYYVRNGYYSFLISPKGEPMQLDIYYPDRKLALEYNGRQHYEYNSYFHRTKAQFKYLQECDSLKRKICKKIGILLIDIPYDKKLSEDYLLEVLKREGVKVPKGDK